MGPEHRVAALAVGPGESGHCPCSTSYVPSGLGVQTASVPSLPGPSSTGQNLLRPGLEPGWQPSQPMELMGWPYGPVLGGGSC